MPIATKKRPASSFTAVSRLAFAESSVMGGRGRTWGRSVSVPAAFWRCAFMLSGGACRAASTVSYFRNSP